MTSCEKSRWRKISIHALREEGDDKTSLFERFQIISIHALREEGDQVRQVQASLGDISIHALREEGDLGLRHSGCCVSDFYPRPPRGGRPHILYQRAKPWPISIHALREEGDPARP